MNERARVHSAPGDAIAAKSPEVLVNRYRGITRLNHWITAGCMILLLLSGFAFFHPSLYWLTSLFGGGQTARWLHPIIGVVLAVSFFGLFVQMWRLNLPRREDVQWAMQTKDVILGHEEKLPELGKYNAGQKVVFWSMAILIMIMVITECHHLAAVFVGNLNHYGGIVDHAVKEE